MDTQQIKDLQSAGIDWLGGPLKVDGVMGPKTAWWQYITSLQAERQMIVFRALRYHAMGVKEDAGKPNRSTWVDTFNEPGGIGPGQPWCAAFVSYVMRQCSVDWPVYHMSAWAMIEHAKRAAMITTDPLPGDVMAFCYDSVAAAKGFTAGHCGIVLASDATHIVDCDGNAGDRVRVGYRYRKGLTFIRTVPVITAVMPDVTSLPNLDGTKAGTR